MVRTNASRRIRPRRSAVTLVELLIVVAISVILLGVAIPQVKPALEAGRVREGARQVTMLLQAARTQAIATGRPAGIALVRVRDGSNEVLDLMMVETPEAYSGDTTTARVRLERTPQSPNKAPAPTGNPCNLDTFQLNFTYTSSNNTSMSSNNASLTDTSSFALIQPGDSFLIRFNYKGELYEAERDSSNNLYYLKNAQISLPPTSCSYSYRSWPTSRMKKLDPQTFWAQGADDQWGEADVDDDKDGVTDEPDEAGLMGNQQGSPADTRLELPYQIYLRPKRSASGSIQMPATTCVDLQYSGVGPVGRQFSVANSDDAYILGVVFDANGAIDYAIYDDDNDGAASILPVASTIHLLVAKSNQVGVDVANTSATPNPISGHTYSETVADPNSIWVSISPRNGNITSAENAWLIEDTSNADFNEALRLGRQFAQEAQTQGGG